MCAKKGVLQTPLLHGVGDNRRNKNEGKGRNRAKNHERKKDPTVNSIPQKDKSNTTFRGFESTVFSPGNAFFSVVYSLFNGTIQVALPRLALAYSRFCEILLSVSRISKLITEVSCNICAKDTVYGKP